MGALRAKQKRYDEAIGHFDRPLPFSLKFVEAWFNKGVAYKEQLDVEEMIRAFQRVIELGSPVDDFVQQAQDMMTVSKNTCAETVICP